MAVPLVCATTSVRYLVLKVEILETSTGKVCNITKIFHSTVINKSTESFSTQQYNC